MAVNLPDLSDLDWMRAPASRRVFELLRTERGGGRIVGGAVRNALADRKVADLDFATELEPTEVMARARAADVRVVPTGIEHGTVTLVLNGRPHEVTTLRDDIETDGRHAVVRFGHDWVADARRRDFTMNALSVDETGQVHDPLGGYDDLIAGRVRFIGDPDTRIAEDRLRLLRLFRFHAEYGAGDLAQADLGAAIRARHQLRDLSAERIGGEMRRLVVARRAPDVVGLMQDSGVLPVILGGIGYIARFRGLSQVEREAQLPSVAALRLAALGARIPEDALRLAARLRLSNKERDRMVAALAVASDVGATPPGASRLRTLLYRHGASAVTDGLALAASSSAMEPSDWPAAIQAAAEETPVPVFPLSGVDAADLGVAEGTEIGRLLRAVEAWWIAQDFQPGETELRQRLAESIKAPTSDTRR